MNNSNRQAESSGTITLGDVYFVIFRHKWMIILSSLAGITAAAAFYLLNPPLYQSEAELFIRYITDSRPVSAPADNSTMTSPTSAYDQEGAVINSEIAILKSFDLAQQVANTIGPAKILAKTGGGADPIAAAKVVSDGLSVEAEGKSSVINIIFRHPDPAIVQPVLSEIITAYLNMHEEIHQALGTEDDFLAEETTQLRSEMSQTERELITARTNAGIISIEDTKKNVGEQIAKIQGQLLDAEVELATRQGGLVATDVLSSVNQPMTNATAMEIPSGQVDEYKKVCQRLDILQKKSGEFLGQGYTEDSVLVKELSGQIAKAEAQKNDLEEKYPELVKVAVPSSDLDGHPAVSADGSASVLELKSRIAFLDAQLNRLRSEALTVGEAEPKILDLQLKQQIQQNNLQYFLKSLDDARMNEALGAGKISGIKPIQQPTPPMLANSKRKKVTGMLLAGGVMGGLALAFLIDMFLDRSIKRPTEIETKLNIPLFLSIPDVGRNGSRQKARKRQLQLENAEGAPATDSDGKLVGKTGRLEIAPWSANHSLRAFYEALRDRIVVHFEVKGLTRKPKLVAVTSANRGAGVTTIAMGLAASLSETGEGNVLLVDMNVEQGAVQQFYKGKPGCPLDDAFEQEKRNGALMQDNLYVVSDSSNGDKLPRIMPRRFSSLLPKFKASDYDYIIFDMPPVSQTSVTARLSGHMDMVVMVVEAEKTSLEVVRRADSLLAESKANVTAVLNKTRKYVPSLLHADFNSES